MSRPLLPLKLLLIFAACCTLLHAEGKKQIEIIPAPPCPNIAGLNREQTVAAFVAWETATKKWEASLTEEQRRQIAIQKAIESEHRAKLPLAADGYDWQLVAATQGLGLEAINQLDKNKLLVGQRQFRQSYEPYTDPVDPVFITSDSLLNAFHVLFEDTFRELEIRRAPQLRQSLEALVGEIRTLLKSPPYPASDLAPGWLHAQRVLGPALVLLGTAPNFFDAEVRADIAAQVRKIREAAAVELPQWMEPPTDELLAIDYRRCRPVGFYAGNARLSDYFRAVRWLQMVPFRVERDTELTAIGLLGYAAKQTETNSGLEFFTGYERFLGRTEDRSLVDAMNCFASCLREKREPDWATALAAERKWLQPKEDAVPAFGTVNDALRNPPRPEQKPTSEPFRILAAYCLPDAALFQFLADRREPVTGLQVAALVGSAWAKKRLTPQQPEILNSGLSQARKFAALDEAPYEPTPLYHEYLRVLGTLFGPADPDAPAFMQSDAWSAKSCQAALAGWAQMRHTFTLQTKLTIATTGAHGLPPGFIEPNPQFLHLLSGFIEHTQAKLMAAGVFDESSASIAARLNEQADNLDTLRSQLSTLKSNDIANGIRSDNPAIQQYSNLVNRPWDLPMTDTFIANCRKARESEANPRQFAEALRDLSRLLRAEAKRFEDGAPAPKPKDQWRSLESRWSHIQQTVTRLETLLQKQLRQRPWDDEEAKFIKDYGETVANIMGAFGNMHNPRDDAHRWVEIVRDPQRDDSLAVGIGRPRIFYVLYPWSGREILCQGAVLPYYEYRSRERLTDDEWRQKLDAPDAPPAPDWIQPLSEKP
jgi:hypothetical protein